MSECGVCLIMQADSFSIEKWIKFRFIITVCSVIYTSKVRVVYQIEPQNDF